VTDDDILEACLQHGAKRVYDAAYSHMLGGDHKALRTVGLPQLVSASEAAHIARVAYRWVNASEQAADLAATVVMLAKLS
jgi:hypothetical protein